MDALAEALRDTGFDPLTARLAAAQAIVAQHALPLMNHRRLISGKPAAERNPEAVRAANHAFDPLRDGWPPAGAG